MKVVGFIVIILGIVMLYIGITGSQHTFMATLKGQTTAKQSGAAINPSGQATSNVPPRTVSTGNNNPPVVAM